ncbi:MAG: hypothetical protein K2X01_01245 [Cyanobacteria bacterium]|nr:hypothetical protein [Cyanobacteriota bacterium]
MYTARIALIVVLSLCFIQAPLGVSAEGLTMEELMQQIRSGNDSANHTTVDETPIEKPPVDFNKAVVPVMPLIKFPHHRLAPLKVSELEAYTLGKNLYQGRCGSCHAVIPVRQFTKREWPGILTRMAPMATLRDEELAMISLYIEKDLEGPAQTPSVK